LYITAIAPPGPWLPHAPRIAAAQEASDPDALYNRRADPASAGRAAEIWAEALRVNPRDFETAWKLARARYWLGGHGDDDGRRRELELGMEAARTAIALRPNAPEGHFWLAANMGALAESHGIRAGLRYRKPIRQELELVLKLDPAFQLGSADRALGRWYFKVPGLFGGDRKKSEAHLRKALTFDEHSTITRYFLAETLLAMNRDAEARAELEKVIDSPGTPGWGPEDNEYRARARQLLRELER
jgi:hypothetical protein